MVQCAHMGREWAWSREGGPGVCQRSKQHVQRLCGQSTVSKVRLEMFKGRVGKVSRDSSMQNLTPH